MRVKQCERVLKPAQTVFNCGTCLRQLWGSNDFFAARSMDVDVSRLRKRLARDPSLEILNIRGVGYKLIT